MMISNCIGKRTFLRLKPIKNDLLSSRLEGRLNCLLFMPFESNVLLKIYFQVIIKEFSRKNSQKSQTCELKSCFNK